jgi:hypothetical protein
MLCLKANGKFPYYVAREACKSRFEETALPDLPDSIIVWQNKEESLTFGFEEVKRLDLRAIKEYSDEAAVFNGMINVMLEKGYCDVEIAKAVKPLADASEQLLYFSRRWFEDYLPVFRSNYEALKKKREEHLEATESKAWYAIEHPKDGSVKLEIEEREL